MGRKRRTPQAGIAEPSRAAVTNDFPTFVGQVEAELAGRIGGARAADHVARDPSFGNLFRLTFDMRNAVANPVKKCANLIVDALASAIVADRLRLSDAGADYAPTPVPPAKVGTPPAVYDAATNTLHVTDEARASQVLGVPDLGAQLAGNPTAQANADSWADANPRRRSRSATSKTGGDGEPSIESLSRPTTPVVEGDASQADTVQGGDGAAGAHPADDDFESHERGEDVRPPGNDA